MDRVAAFQASILAWYKVNKRSLPWRSTSDPYRIMVSEIMLQQTQVDRVLPKYLQFIKAYPSIEDLAKAPPAKLIALWSGLGYNRRIINLQRAAQHIVTRESFPDQLEELLLLPGIGPYTSRAILSFAYAKDVAVVDTNVRRVFSRLFFSKRRLIIL